MLLFFLHLGLFDLPGWVDLWIALFTVLLKMGLTIHSWRVGQQTGNSAVLALAYDHRNDIFSAGAATVGILLGQLGYAFVDPLAGATVALIVLGTGIQIIRESTGWQGYTFDHETIQIT